VLTTNSIFTYGTNYKTRRIKQIWFSYVTKSEYIEHIVRFDGRSPSICRSGVYLPAVLVYSVPNYTPSNASAANKHAHIADILISDNLPSAPDATFIGTHKISMIGGWLTHLYNEIVLCPCSEYHQGLQLIKNELTQNNPKSLLKWITHVTSDVANTITLILPTFYSTMFLKITKYCNGEFFHMQGAVFQLAQQTVTTLVTCSKQLSIRKTRS